MDPLEQPTAVEDVVNAIVELVNTTDYVSFAEISQRFPRFAATDGDSYSVGFGKEIIWYVSKFGHEVFRALLNKVSFSPTNMLVYLIDGSVVHVGKGETFVPLVLRPNRHTNYVTAAGMNMCLSNKMIASAKRASARAEKKKRAMT